MFSIPLVSALAQCRRLFLRNHLVEINIGAHAFEHGRPQRVRINVDLYTPLTCSTPLNDNLGEVVNYDFVREVVRERVGRGHINLQETLADDLLRTWLAHPHVVAARVSTEKPDVYPDCEAVGVEIFGFKDGLVAGIPGQSL